MSKQIKLKPCPFRIHSEKTASVMVYEGFYYNGTFIPCMGEYCAYYYDSGDEIRCYRDNTYLILAERKQDATS